MKTIFKATTLIVIWVVICVFPLLLVPVFIFLPLIKLYLMLGFANVFMSDIDIDDKRKHNRFSADDFILGTMNERNRKK